MRDQARRRSRAAAATRAAGRAPSRASAAPSRVVAHERHAPVRALGRASAAWRRRAAARRSASPAPRVSSSASGSASSSRDARVAEPGGHRVALEQRRPRRAPRACGRARRGGGSALCSTPCSAASSGSTLRRQPVGLHQLQAAADVARGDHPLELGEHALRRRRARSPGRSRRPRRRVAGIDLEPELDGEPDGAQRAQRVVDERVRRDHPHAAARSRSARPPCGSSSVAAVQRLAPSR